MKEGIDVAFRLGVLEDSSLGCAASWIASACWSRHRTISRRAASRPTPQELIGKKHDCLMLRYPGVREHFWTLKTPAGPQKFEVHGPFDSDDGDVLTGWALSGPRHHQQAALRGRAVHPRPAAEGHPGRHTADAGAACRRLPAQEAAGPEGAAAARLHGRALPAADQGYSGGKVTAQSAARH